MDPAIIRLSSMARPDPTPPNDGSLDRSALATPYWMM